MAGEKLVRRALQAAREATTAPREGIRAYHSSPHDFDRFDLSKIGTGEGAQAYGHGLYFAENPRISDRGGDYWRQFLNKMPSGPEQSAATALFANKFDRDKAIDHLLRDVEYNSARGVPGKYGNAPDIEEGHRLLAQENQQALDILRSGQIAGPRTYEVNIRANPEQFLDWDKPLREQPKALDALRPILGDADNSELKFRDNWIEKSAAERAFNSGDIEDLEAFRNADPDVIAWHRSAAETDFNERAFDDPSFWQRYSVEKALDDANKRLKLANDPRMAEQVLNEAGIPGIKYLDAGSRAVGEGTRNYVVFDDRLIDIMKKYGLPMMTAGAGAASMADQPGAVGLGMAQPNAEEPRQGFEIGGPVDYNDAPNYALDAETSRFNMGDVFAPRTRGLSQGKNPVRAEPIPLARPVAPPEPDVVSRALNVVRAEPRPMDIKVSRQAPPPPRPVPRPAPRPAPAPAQAALNTSESRRLWEIYNETGNPADFVRASNAMRAGRAEGGEAPPTTPDQRLDVVNTYLEDVVDQSLNRTPMAPFNRISEPATPAPFTTPEERINVLRTYFGDVADQRHNRSLTPVVEEAPRARSVADPNRQSYLEAFGPPQTSAGLTANTPAPLAPGEYGRQKLDRMMTNIFGPNARERAISAARNVFAPPSPYLSPGEYGRHRLDAIINNLIDPSLLGSKATLGVEDIRGGVVLPDRAGSAPPPSDYRMEPSRPAIQEQAPAPAPTASMPVQAEAKASRFSDDDVEALANMIAGEASTQSREGMAQVGQVALNRAMMNYNNYGDTLQAQLSRPRQFAGYNSPTAKAIMAGGTPQQQAIAQQAREIARGLIDGTIQPKFANATDFNRGSPSFNAKRGAANAERLGTHTFFNASPAYAKRLERARREREGRATGGIVDDALNVVRELPQEDRVRVAMFAGEGAVGAPLQSLDVAKQLLAKGATPEEAYRGSSSDGATGWFQGADGRWRFEISDKDAALNQESFERLRAGESVRPEQLFQHPRLFEMYPHLNEIQLGLVPQDQYDDGLIGSFNPRTNTLSLPPDPAKAYSNMLHELQHSIQEHERFGAGGDSDQIKRALKAEAVLEQLRARNRIVDMMREGENRMFDTNYRDPEQVSRLREFQKENERRISGERGLIPPLEQRVNDLAPTGRWGSLKDYELYRRLAGETEARNVQNRMMMDLEERRSSFPGATQDYPNEEQYIRLRGERAEGGRLLEDEYPTHYLPNVGRQVMADGGTADEKYEAMPGFFSRLLGLDNRRQPEADIQQYENRMRAIARQPEDIRSMTHAPSKPMRPIEIEGGLIGKRTLGEVPYDVAGPLAGTAQTAYSLKTLPFYFTPAAPLAAAADFGEAAIDTAKAAREGDYLGAGITGALGVAMPGYAYRKPIGDVVGRALNAIRGNPGAVGAGAAGAAMVAPEEAEAGKLDAAIRAARNALSGAETLRGADLVAKDPRAATVNLSKRTPSGEVDFGQGINNAEYTFTSKGDLQPWKEFDPYQAYKERALIAGLLGDRSAAGSLVHDINGVRLTEPVNRTGGGEFQRSTEGPEVWASRPSAVKNMYTRINKGMSRLGASSDTPVLASHIVMGLPGIDSTQMMAKSVLRQIEPTRGNIDPNVVEAFDASVRKKYPGWPGILNPEEAEAFLAKKEVGKRTSTILQMLDNKRAQVGGLPNLGAARFAMMEPRLVSADQGATGFAISRLDPNRVTNAAVSDTYPTGMLGPSRSSEDYVGGTRYQIPLNVMFPDWSKKIKPTYVEKKTGLTKATTPTQIQQSVLTQVPLQRASQEWLDNLMAYMEANPKKWGYRRGGSVSHRALMIAQELGSSPRETVKS